MSDKTFPNEVKIEVANSQNGYCAEEYCFLKIHSIHHKLKNTKYNRAKFPLFIHSPMNGVGLCFKDHKNNSHKHKISERQAMVYENYLTKIKGE